MTDWRRGSCGGLQCTGDKRFDIGDGGRVDGALEMLGGVLRREGGLHRQRRCLGASLGCAWDTAADLVGDGERLTEPWSEAPRKIHLLLGSEKRKWV